MILQFPVSSSIYEFEHLVQIPLKLIEMHGEETVDIIAENVVHKSNDIRTNKLFVILII
jgi:hypothetical protein